MEIYPAIDLKNGQCVRLYQGSFDQVTNYSDDPIAMAQYFESKFSTLHVVDLDAARDPEQQQLDLIISIVNTVKMTIQIGGGIRTRSQIYHLLEQGVARVIIGSKAVLDPNLVKEWFKEFGADKIVLAVDFKLDEKNIPRVVMNGWQNTSEITVGKLIQLYEDVNLKHILCTDITRDGTLAGANINFYADLCKKFPSLHIQASGGITLESDLERLKTSGVKASIVGKYLYEKMFKK